MLVAVAIATIFYVGAWTKKSRIIYRIGLVALFLFVVFRCTNISGYDSTSYMNFFNSIPSLGQFNWKFWNCNFMYSYGWGYALLNSVAKTLGNNYFVFQCIDTLLVFFLLSKVINKLKLDDREKCMFLFVYFCSKFIWYYFILLRQNIANLIIWYVLIDWSPRRKHRILYYIRDLLLIYLAYLFHSTAAFLFFIYPLYIILHFISDKIKVMFSIPISVGITVVTTYMMPQILNLLVMVAGTRYLAYEGRTSGGINYLNYALRIGYLILILKRGKKYYKYENSLNGTVLTVLMGAVNVTFNVRLLEFFAVGYYSGLAHIKGYLSRWGKYMVLAGVYVLYIAMLLQYIVVNNPKMIQYQIFAF